MSEFTNNEGEEVNEKHQLTLQEKGQCIEIRDAIIKFRESSTDEFLKSLPIPTNLLIAQFAIVTKGEVSVALKRYESIVNVTKEHKLNTVTYEESLIWMNKTMPGCFIPCLPDNGSRPSIGVDCEFYHPSKVVTEEDWTMFFKVMFLLMETLVIFVYVDSFLSLFIIISLSLYLQ
jgi:hypothetical protein